MKYLRAFFARLSGLFSKNSHDVEFNQELESHLQMHIDDNIRSGMSPEEARRQALIKFGSIETAKESVRESSRLLWLETAWQDMCYALRGLRLNNRKSTRLNSSHRCISYAVFCLKKKI